MVTNLLDLIGSVLLGMSLCGRGGEGGFHDKDAPSHDVCAGFVTGAELTSDPVCPWLL